MAARKSKSKRRVQPRQRFSRVAALWLAGITVAVGVFVVLFSRAAGSARIYIDPSATQVAVGSTVQVTVRVDSGSTPVNAVQADVSYPSATLDFLGADGTGSAFGVEAPSNNSTGLVSVTRGTITPVTGDQPVVKLTFRVKSGSSAVAVKNSSVLASSSSNSNVLGSYGSATLGVLSVNQTPPPTAKPTSAPTASPSPTLAPTTTPVAVTESPTPVPSATASPTATPVASATPSPTPAVTGTNSKTTPSTLTLPAPTGVPVNSTTTYEVDGKAVQGNTLDATTVSDGSHNVTATTVDANGKVVKTSQTTVNVNTKKTFWQNALLVAKENIAAIVLVLLLIAVAVGGFIFYRRNLAGGGNSLAWPS